MKERDTHTHKRDGRDCVKQGPCDEDYACRKEGLSQRGCEGLRQGLYMQEGRATHTHAYIEGLYEGRFHIYAMKDNALESGGAIEENVTFPLAEETKRIPSCGSNPNEKTNS